MKLKFIIISAAVILLLIICYYSQYFINYPIPNSLKWNTNLQLSGLPYCVSMYTLADNSLLVFCNSSYANQNGLSNDFSFDIFNGDGISNSSLSLDNVSYFCDACLRDDAIYITGKDLNANTTQNIQSNGNNNIFFINSYDLKGQQLSVNNLDISDMMIGGICVDNNNNIIIFGTITGPVDFNFQEGTSLFAPLNSSDYFIAKYNVNLELDFVNILEVSLVYDIDIDDQNNIIIFGEFSKELKISSQGGQYNIKPDGFNKFIGKMDDKGNWQWIKSWDCIQANYILDNQELIHTVPKQGLYTDNNGNIINFGQYTGIVDFDLGPNIDKYEANRFGYYVTKISNNGDTLWTKAFNYPVQDVASDINDNIYVIGAFKGNERINNSYYFSRGSYNIFICKYNQNGQYLNSVVWGFARSDEVGKEIAIDNDLNIYVLWEMVRANVYTLQLSKFPSDLL